MQNLLKALDPILSRVRSDISAVKQNGGMFWTKEPITPDRIKDHLNGGPSRGVCPIKEGENTTKVALLDLDSHKGETSWLEMVKVGELVIAELQLRGMNAIPWSSSGGKGIHLFILWDEPQDAYSVREFLKSAIEFLGYRNGTAGVAEKEIEIFPKQDFVPLGGCGNQFILPLAGKSVPLADDGFGDLDLTTKDHALSMDWPVSAPVPVLTPPVSSTKPAHPAGYTPDLERLSEMLAYISPDISYDDWLRIGMALHHETRGSNEGLGLWNDWSSKGETYPGYEELEKKWASFRNNKERPVTGGTIIQLASKGGWVEKASRYFSVVKAEQSASLALPDWSLVGNGGGTPAATIPNIRLALERPDICGLDLRFDTFRDEIMFSSPGKGEWQTFTDNDNTVLRDRLQSDRRFKPITKEIMRDVISLVADRNKFDSAIEWLHDLPAWDGIPRVEQFLARYFGTGSTPYTQAVSRYIWTAFAGRIIKPGIKADMVPIFVGDQGTGKSSAIAALVPSEEFFVEISFDESDDNLARKMRGRLVGEIAELRGLRTKDVEHIKAFVVRTHEKWVPKYKEFASSYPRRLILIGTTNNEQFLADETGHRRWLPVQVERIDVDAIKRNREQLWAEGLALFNLNGIDWRAENLSELVHDQYRAVDPWEDAIRDWLAKCNLTAVRVTDVLRDGLGMRVDLIDNRAEKRVGAILRALGFTRTKKRVAGKASWFFIRTAEAENHEGACDPFEPHGKN